MTIDQIVLDDLQKLATNLPDLECCGVLSGQNDGRIDGFQVFPGPLHSSRFRLPDEWLLKTFLNLRRRGLRVEGFFHSHPPGSALFPSTADRLGHPLGSRLLLLGADGDECEAFELVPSGFRPLKITIG